ncbi:MAG: hypothetical protein Q8P31_01330, partial [Bacillota bacterium]|nr:hypothetical protein [Bacillota bacterium]
MKEAAFRQYCRERGLSDEDVGKAVTAVLNLEAFARHRDKTLESLDTQTLQDHISQLVIQGDNTPERLRALQDYMRATCNGDLVVHLLGLLAGREVLPNIAQRLEQLAGPAARASVFQGLELPPLGSPQSAYPAVTQQVVARLRGALPEEACITVLAGNHHQIPAERFAALRTIYLEKGLDAALAHRHRELVKQLEAHLASGEPWFEQMVTPAFVDHVRHNPEIGAGVGEGDRVYFTKVPYAPQQYYDERDPTMKRYYQC